KALTKTINGTQKSIQVIKKDIANIMEKPKLCCTDTHLKIASIERKVDEVQCITDRQMLCLSDRIAKLEAHIMSLPPPQMLRQGYQFPRPPSNIPSAAWIPQRAMLQDVQLKSMDPSILHLKSTNLHASTAPMSNSSLQKKPTGPQVAFTSPKTPTAPPVDLAPPKTPTAPPMEIPSPKTPTAPPMELTPPNAVKTVLSVNEHFQSQISTSNRFEPLIEEYEQTQNPDQGNKTQVETAQASLKTSTASKKVLWIGDSRLKNVQNIDDNIYVIIANSGDRIQDVNRRICDMLYDNTMFSDVIIDCGVNNIRSDRDSPDKCMELMEKIIKDIQKVSPKINIIIGGVLPVQNDV
ncbi:unnamed protein product, partial [Owenia fusiformis]